MILRQIIREEFKRQLKKRFLNEAQEFDFKNKESFMSFLSSVEGNELDDKSIIIGITKTYAMDDSSGQNFTGKIVLDNVKRSGKTSGGDFSFTAKLNKSGGYKYLEPAEGKEINLVLPASSSEPKGSIQSKDPEISCVFNVTDLQITM